MKPYLVDVPVAIQVFIRPEMLELQWAVIREARPSVLFIRSDGPRESVPTDRALVERSRAVVAEVDWECDVHRLYFEENQGLYGVIERCDEVIWQTVDRCIYLEDDMIPSVSFFQFCAEMLEKYKDDTRIVRVSGVNTMGQWHDTSGDYFFSRVPSSSGCGVWRRTRELSQRGLSFLQDPFVMKNLKKILPWHLYDEFCGHRDTGSYANHKPAGEFFVRVGEFAESQLVIVPSKNLIRNIGFGEGSTHSGGNLHTLPRALQPLYNLPIFELSFPLCEPTCVIEDVYYRRARERQLGVISRVQAASRAVERAVRLLLYGEAGRLYSVLRKRLKNTIEK